jgi:hypothetical protein
MDTATENDPNFDCSTEVKSIYDVLLQRDASGEKA